MQQLLEYTEQYIGNPVAVTTGKLEVLAYSKNICPDDETWNNVIIGNAGRYDAYHKLKEAGVLKKLVEQSLILTDAPDIFPRRWLAQQMMYRGHYIGQLLVLEYEKAFQPEDRAILDVLCELCAYYIATQKNTLRDHESLAESILMDIIAGKSIPEGIIKEHLADIPWNKKLRHRILTISPENNISYNMHPIKYQLLKLLPLSCGILSGNRIILLVSWESAKSDPTSSPDLAAFLEKEQLLACVSGYFVNITDASIYYTQADRLLFCASHLIASDRILHAYDFAPEFLFEHCTDRTDLSCFYHDSIKTILQYDEEYHTNYLEDLYAYLSVDMNINRTAELLGIHRNTVKYRIGKLEELFRINFHNPDEVFSMKFTFRILRYQSKNRAPQMEARFRKYNLSMDPVSHF